MGLSVKTELNVDELELSLLVFLSTAFPEILVADQENYCDEDGKIDLPIEYQSAFLIAHSRIDYRSLLLPSKGPRPTLAITPCHVFSIILVCRDRNDARGLLTNLRHVAPSWYPSDKPQWILFPSSEQDDGEVDGLFHFTAFYCMEEAYAQEAMTRVSERYEP